MKHCLYNTSPLQECTHRHDNILDVVICSDDDNNFIRDVSCLPYCLIISLFTLMYLYRKILFQLKLFPTRNTSQLTKALFLLIWGFFSGIGPMR